MPSWITAADAAGDVYSLMLAGPYQFNWLPNGIPLHANVALPPSVTMTLAQGALFDWTVAIAEWRFRVHLIAPTRQFPDVVGLTGAANGGLTTVTNTYSISSGIETPAQYTTPQKDVVLQLPPANDAGYDYTLWVFGVPLTIPAGAANTQADITISRIDVAAVSYTKADGTAATAAGNWSATRAAGAPGPTVATQLQWQLGFNPNTSAYPYQEWIPQVSFPTNTGIDVIGGNYIGSVTYNLADLGGQQTYPFIASF